MRSKKQNTIFSMIITAIFAALIAVGAFVSINIGEVPFTLQSFVIFLAFGTIGWKRGTASVGIYLLMGLIGVPVFAGFKSGAGVLFGPTGGFLLGFLLAGFVYGIISYLFRKIHIFGFFARLVASFFGTVAVYICGCLMYTAVYLKEVTYSSLGTAFLVCVAPFIIVDIVKMFVAAAVSVRLVKIKMVARMMGSIEQFK